MRSKKYFLCYSRDCKYDKKCFRKVEDNNSSWQLLWFTDITDSIAPSDGIGFSSPRIHPRGNAAVKMGPTDEENFAEGDGIVSATVVRWLLLPFGKSRASGLAAHLLTLRQDQ
ncbi:MAG: hypothetical protein D6814_01890 [Calditrichaeota bacterium]|nr:MAG: hypothetical protein D6814_01890 [Calditrichota bacterium]